MLLCSLCERERTERGRGGEGRERGVEGEGRGGGGEEGREEGRGGRRLCWR